MSNIRIRWREGAPSSAVFHVPASLLVEGPQALRPGDVATVRDAPLWRQELRPSDPGLELVPDQVEPAAAPELEPAPAAAAPELEPAPAAAAPELEPAPAAAAPELEPAPAPAPVR